MFFPKCTFVDSLNNCIDYVKKITIMFISICFNKYIHTQKFFRLNSSSVNACEHLV